MLPSASQGLLSLIGARAQLPVVTSQVFLRQALSWSLGHATMVEGWILHWNGAALVSQKSVPLQGLPSSEPAQSASLTQEQVFAPATQAPSLQASFSVQTLSSLHGPALAAWAQPSLASQLSSVHGLASSQKLAASIAVPVQLPLLQASPIVQALPSSHGAVLLL